MGCCTGVAFFCDVFHIVELYPSNIRFLSLSFLITGRFFLFKFWFLSLLPEEQERKRKKEPSSLCWFTPQMPQTARHRPGQSWDPGLQSGSPTWIVRLQYLNHHLLPLRVYVWNKLESGIWSQGIWNGMWLSQVASWQLCQMPTPSWQFVLDAYDGSDAFQSLSEGEKLQLHMSKLSWWHHTC